MMARADAASGVTAAKYTVGQQVWVYGQAARNPVTGIITKVGRTLVTVEFGHRQEKFRMESGRLAGDWPDHYRIRTEQERRDDDRSVELRAELRAAGVEIRPGARPSLPLLEDLAAAARKHRG